MCYKHLYIVLCSLTVLSGVICKEKAAEVDISDYQDATIPVDSKNPQQVDPPEIISYDTTSGFDSTTATASPEDLISRAESSAMTSARDALISRAESSSTASPGVADSSTTRSQPRAELESKTMAAPRQDEEKRKLVANTTSSIKHPTIEPVSVKILRAETNGISVTDVALSKPKMFVNSTGVRVYSVDYHYAKKFIFYSALNRIFRDEVVGRLGRAGAPAVVLAAGVEGAVRLAVDWLHDRLYWLSDNQQTVEAADLDGQNRSLLVDNLSGIRFPNNIAVDPYAGYLFLVSNYSIFRADLDGNDLTRLPLEDEARGVKCLALDRVNRRVFYSGKEGHPETGTPYIASCDYDGGSGREHSLAGRWNDIFALDVFLDTLYFAHFSNRTPDTTYSADLKKQKLTPVRLQTEEASNGDIWSVRVYHPGVQTRNAMNCTVKNDKAVSGG